MKRITILTIIAVSLALVAFGSPSLTGGLAATNNSLEDRVATLEGEIALHLEELRVHEEHILALEAIQWREPGKVSQAVVDRLWERASSCQNNDDCYYGDPLLYAFYSIPYEERHTYVIDLIIDGNWNAEQTDDAHWAVSAQLGEDKPFIFLVDTTYHVMCWDQSEFCAARDFTGEG